MDNINIYEAGNMHTNADNARLRYLQHSITPVNTLTQHSQRQKKTYIDVVSSLFSHVFAFILCIHLKSS